MDCDLHAGLSQRKFHDLSAVFPGNQGENCIPRFPGKEEVSLSA